MRTTHRMMFVLLPLELWVRVRCCFGQGSALASIRFRVYTRVNDGNGGDVLHLLKYVALLTRYRLNVVRKRLGWMKMAISRIHNNHNNHAEIMLDCRRSMSQSILIEIICYAQAEIRRREPFGIRQTHIINVHMRLVIFGLTCACCTVQTRAETLMRTQCAHTYIDLYTSVCDSSSRCAHADGRSLAISLI